MVLPHVCAALAHYKEEELSQVAQQTSQLARQFFAIEANIDS